MRTPVTEHRTILIVDVEGFGNRRTNRDQLEVRTGLYKALREAFATSGVPWDHCDPEDRGDGVFVLAPADIAKTRFSESLPGALADALRKHNRTHPESAQIRLRVAVHAGEVNYDNHGVTGASINFAFRLIDAPVVKAALAQSPGVLALITSSWFYDEVVRHSTASDPGSYRKVAVVAKETTADAWISLLGHPFPPGSPEGDDAPVPRQLPVDTLHFVGRQDEVAELHEATRETGIISLNGTAGVGKTALALHWAHQFADQWPDGQLYVNLRGFDPTASPAEPAEVLRGFLDALNVPARQMPADVHGRTDLFRSVLRDRRVLVVLDNAADSSQVLPLLPDSPQCLTVITSRRRLAPSSGARTMHLDALTEEDATAFLTSFLGQARVAAEPDAVARIVEYCARLPLALGIAARRAAVSPTMSLGQMADDLAGVEADPADATNAVILWGYRALSTSAGRLFRVLGRHAGPEFGVDDAAVLAGLSDTETRKLIMELSQARLVEAHLPGAYRFRDTLRAFAMTLDPNEDETATAPAST